MDWDIKQSLLAGFYNGCRAHGSVMSEHVKGEKLIKKIYYRTSYNALNYERIKSFITDSVYFLVFMI